MLGTKKFWSMALSLLLVVAFAVPSFAADPDVSVKDLKGISPQHHRYLFSVAGGALVGAGIGALLGSGNDLTKGIMVGAGGASAMYLHSHRHDQMRGWRNWAYIASYTSLAGGAAWTLCGCDDGLVAGTLIGAGASAIWRAEQPAGRTVNTAQTTP